MARPRLTVAVVEACESRTVFAGGAAAAFEPLHLTLNFTAPATTVDANGNPVAAGTADSTSTVPTVEGDLTLSKKGGKLVGQAAVDGIGSIDFSARLNGPSAKVKLTLPGGAAFEGKGLGVGGRLADGTRTLELRGSLDRAGGGGSAGTFSVDGSDAYTPVSLGNKAAGQAAPTVAVRLDDFQVKITTGPDAGTAYAGSLQLTPTGKGHDVSGQLVLAGGAGSVPVTGRLGAGTVRLTFDLGNGQSITGTGAFARKADGNLYAIGTAAGPAAGDRGVWAASSSGYWSGYWTWNTTTSTWFWTWVWYANTTGFQTS